MMTITDIPVPVSLHPLATLTDEEFFEFCQRNKALHIERDAEGEVTVMAPAGGYSSGSNSDLTADFTIWARKNGKGKVFNSSGGFILPNGATRSPDVSWVRFDRLKRLSGQTKVRFIPLAPDLVVELRSQTDGLLTLKEKMDEYIDNGVRMGWLIDPQNEAVWVYQPDTAPQRLEKPSYLTGIDDFADLSIPINYIWKPYW